MQALVESQYRFFSAHFHVSASLQAQKELQVLGQGARIPVSPVHHMSYSQSKGSRGHIEDGYRVCTLGGPQG